ncbi:hypothetical protein [Staphylococcus simulans]|uniref:Polymer-forming cytoskeletal protein n=1 Tax=Staphylococcus simulans UMC-CNS-990 TaxID=1405498 RepID=A0ABP2YY90_STASI|nr:hypothetical protein [Staphylococcus simulans]ERS94550.1 hypothetical protein SSIM_00220 [Staphylococcus simulans UMC-CNS-990]MCE5148030.1 hypothetical protein [Staphylococcus simulans]PTJ32819.1 hypothetical protein BU026_07345 [Staphylococcus simulans]
MSQSIKGMGKKQLEDSEYDAITLLGEVQFPFETSVNNIKMTGEITASDQVNVNKIKLIGNFTGRKNVHVTTASIIGEVEVEEDLTFELLKVTGTVDVKGHLNGKRLKLLGVLETEGNCEVDELKIDGQVKVEGMLNADTVDVHVRQDSYVREIGGNVIHIRKHDGEKRKFKFITVMTSQSDSAYLTAEVIEGDCIEVNRVKAKVIRGDHIILHEDVEVETIEYTKTLECAQAAQIGKITKL